ncbi:hypothetical protein ACQ4PT_021127 [Festuca glaucescens]
MESWSELPQILLNGIVHVLRSVAAFHSDRSSVEHHVHNGGCIEEFGAALEACHPDYIRQRGEVAGDAEACAKATAALHKCFAGNREWFRHQFICRLEEGLDQDLKPSPEQVKMEDETRFRWWTGMNRS